MADLKTCLRRVKQAGYDTSGLPIDELANSSDPFSIIDSETEALRAEHRDLSAKRELLLKNASVMEPLAPTKPAPKAPPKPKKQVRQGPPQESSTMHAAQEQTNKAGLPKKAATQEPRPLKNLGTVVANEKKAISTEEEAVAVSRVIQNLRRAQGTGKEYHELSPSYAVKKAKLAGKMEEIRAMFPTATSDKEAMMRFQKIAKNQVSQEKYNDESPVFTKREAKQLGAYNEEIIAQRADEEVEGRERESSPDELVEGATEVEPKTAEATLGLYTNQNGQRTEVDGVVGIARRLKNLFPAATIFRTPDEKNPGLNTYTIRQENVEEDVYSAPTGPLMQAVAKAFWDGRRSKERYDDGSPNNKVVVLYDRDTGEKVKVGSVSVTKIGEVLDQTTQDVGMGRPEKSAKQFAAGLAFLMTEGNLTLTKPVDKKKLAEEAKAAKIEAIDKTGNPAVRAALKTLSLDVLNTIEKVEYMSEAYMAEYPKAFATAEMGTGIIRINGLKAEKTPKKIPAAMAHESGHLVDAELNMKPSKELPAELIQDAADFANDPTHPLHKLTAAIFDQYLPANWPKEIVAQIMNGHHLKPQELKHAWPAAHAYAEKIHDDLRRKREFVAKRQAERSAKGAQGSGETTGQQGRGSVQSKKPEQVPPGTIIHAKTKLTFGQSQRYLQNSSLRKSKGRGLAKAIKADTYEPSVDAPRDEMVTTKEEGLAKEEPGFERVGEPKEKKGLKRTVSIVGDDPADTRNFESEEAQARRSSGKAKTSPELIGASIRPKEPSVENADAQRAFARSTQSDVLGAVPRKFIGMMNNLFSLLGIQTKVLVVDKAGAQTLLKEPGLPSQWKNNLEAVLKDEPAGRLMLSDSSVASERFAIIYIDTSKPRSTQQEAFMHELGHIVQLAKLDQASDEVQSALRDAHKGTGSQLAFEEWFANQLIKWVGVNKEAKSALDRFFKELAAALKKVWRKLRVDSTYEQYMDSLVAANAVKRGREKPASGKYRRDWIEDMASSVDGPFLPVSDKAYYNMTPEPRSQAPGVVRAGKGVLNFAKHHAEEIKEGAQEGFGAFHSVVTQSVDSYLRSNGLAWLADHFHKRPDVGVPRVGPTIETQIRIEQGQFEPHIDKIMALMPKNISPNDPVYKQAVDDLIGQVDNPSPLAKQILKYFKEQEKYLHKNGVKFKTRKKYFPIMLDVHTWIQRKDKVISIAMDELGKTQEQAEELYRSVAANPNKLFDMSTDYDVRSTGSFGHSQQRTFGPKEHKAFQEFINTDLVSVVKTYTHSAVKHVVYKQHFGVDNRMDPLANLKLMLTRAVIAQDITQEVYDRTWNTMLPALFGQLGADVNPGWRTMQSGAIFYQNIRLLGTAVFANLVDLAGVTYRRGKVSGQWAGIKSALAAMSDKDAQATFRTLGVIRDDLTESILNDPTATQFYSPKIRRWNEKFFKWNGMHALTNFSRIYAFTMGKQYILEKAREGDTAALLELGLTIEQVNKWDRDGRMLDNANENNRAVLYAMHQFTDESILRPSASMRPAWMSDQRWMLVANLKQFIFTYYETIIRRVISQGKLGQFKNPAVLFPFIGFFVIAMTFSMSGYELRKQLMNAGDVPAYARADAWDYMWEGVQRAGMLGPLQFAVDAVEAESRGNMALMSLLGPTASQLEQFMTEDLSYSLSRALPGFAQSPALREWVR